jgi:hypothetical protein
MPRQQAQQALKGFLEVKINELESAKRTFQGSGDTALAEQSQRSIDSLQRQLNALNQALPNK